MNGRCGRVLAAMLVAALFGLTGCGDAITVHSMAKGVRADLEVPAVAGRWQLANGESGAPLLIVDHRPDDTGLCRAGLVRYVESGETTEAGDEVCFVELNGQLVAEFRTTAPLAGFYRQYLVRIASDRIELCGGLPIWVMLAELKQDRPTGYSFDSLQHTVREQEFGDLMVVISKPKEMREFLETALPELGAACDLGGENFKWGAFERAPQEEADAEAEADATG
jgi:hypothetical protein